jgi:''chromo'' (CHRromatin Organisation MOdifier) domain.
LVVWKGFDISDATWEISDNLDNATEKLKEYWASVES